MNRSGNRIENVGMDFSIDENLINDRRSNAIQWKRTDYLVNSPDSPGGQARSTVARMWTSETDSLGLHPRFTTLPALTFGLVTQLLWASFSSSGK